MKIFDTIAAIATPVGVGGIAIIRISGDAPENLLSGIIFPKNKKALADIESHKLGTTDSAV